MAEMHLKQPYFTYSACVLSLTKIRERIQKFKETRHSGYIYQNELDKACFQHDLSYRDFNDLTRRTASDKTLLDKAFSFTKDSKYDGYLGGLTSIANKSLKKNCAARAYRLARSGIKERNMSGPAISTKLTQTNY